MSKKLKLEGEIANVDFSKSKTTSNKIGQYDSIKLKIDDVYFPFGSKICDIMNKQVNIVIEVKEDENNRH